MSAVTAQPADNPVGQAAAEIEPVDPAAVVASQTALPQSGALASYTETNLRPLRMMWNTSHGYCTEASLQMTALARGVWVSQRQARTLGTNNNTLDHPDLWMDAGRDANQDLWYVLKVLGFETPANYFWWTDNQTVTPDPESTGTLTPPASQFMLWVKQHLLAGRPVISAFRTIVDSGQPDMWYDHVMPFFGVGYNTASGLGPTDLFVFTGDYTDECRHTVDTPGFYSKWTECPFDDDKPGQGGCIPSDYYNLGIAVGQLKAPTGLYLPTRLTITEWANLNFPANQEPGELSESVGNTVQAKYQVAVSGLTVGKSYALYKVSGLFSNSVIPQTAAALQTACASRGAGKCVRLPFIAKTASMQFTQDSLLPATGPRAPPPKTLGTFPANSIQYFLVV